jgi:hypothetical protein
MFKRYHREIGFPSDVKIMTQTISLYPSHHAQEAAKHDRYGVIRIPSSVRVTPENVIEMDVQDGRPNKYVVRVPYDERHDISIAVNVFGPGHGVVRTVWLNKKTDVHTTLDYSKYDTPDY